MFPRLKKVLGTTLLLVGLLVGVWGFIFYFIFDVGLPLSLVAWVGGVGVAYLGAWILGFPK